MNDTREKILSEALALFSVNGFDGVSMSDIADTVGIKAASIYKHYTGKEDIFNSIVQRFKDKTDSIFNPELLNNTDYVNISMEMLVGMIQRTFQIYAEDPFLSKCRRLFMLSAFNRPEIGKLYAENFILLPIQYQEGIFEMLQRKNGLTSINVSVMAYHFYTPILILLQEYDYKSITMEEALKKIEMFVAQFKEVYNL